MQIVRCQGDYHVADRRADTHRADIRKVPPEYPVVFANGLWTMHWGTPPQTMSAPAAGSPRGGSHRPDGQ